MSPRYRPPTLTKQGIEIIFEKRNLDLDLFKLLVKAKCSDTAIASVLSEAYKEKFSIDKHIAARTIKRYKQLL